MEDYQSFYYHFDYKNGLLYLYFPQEDLVSHLSIDMAMTLIDDSCDEHIQFLHSELERMQKEGFRGLMELADYFHCEYHENIKDISKIAHEHFLAAFEANQKLTNLFSEPFKSKSETSEENLRVPDEDSEEFRDMYGEAAHIEEDSDSEWDFETIEVDSSFIDEIELDRGGRTLTIFMCNGNNYDYLVPAEYLDEIRSDLLRNYSHSIGKYYNSKIKGQFPAITYINPYKDISIFYTRLQSDEKTTYCYYHSIFGKTCEVPFLETVDKLYENYEDMVEDLKCEDFKFAEDEWVVQLGDNANYKRIFLSFAEGCVLAEWWGGDTEKYYTFGLDCLALYMHLKDMYKIQLEKIRNIGDEKIIRVDEYFDSPIYILKDNLGFYSAIQNNNTLLSGLSDLDNIPNSKHMWDNYTSAME